MTDLLHLRAEGPEVRPALRESQEIQGNVLAAFNKDHQVFRFVRFTDEKLGRTWLAAMLGHIATTADVEDFNEVFSLGRTMFGGDPAGLKATWANVSLTPGGLVELSINPDATREDLREHFPHTAEQAARANGDTDDSAPARWLFGRADQRVHAVVTVASDDEDRLAATTRNLDVLDTLLGVTVVHEQRAATLPGERRGREHFGYKDGVSQPAVRGFHHEDRDRPGHRAARPGEVLVNAGEFVFGHPTESARPEAAAWLADGSIQVIRRLTQDVEGWHDAVERHGRGPELIGRHPDGRPLAGVRANDFDYSDDPTGAVTPCPAHIRKTNPRAFAHRTPRQHRILRRGIPFGPADDGDGERGLVFVAHCTSLAEQFEFIQQTRARNPDFTPGERGAPTGVDPVIGGGFVRTTGALYALVPSVSTLRLLAAGRELPR
ncbi:Dyp-type peroxidase family [Saccharothrix saharensis]|uniref:Dyp-type peroxidase family n=1 Tax=Saccharothrix saharensis TaxID=571190 RepID=A0A543JMD4_9PSEU|nr:Dyp-type peroxidase [Saccharothrix saharensis]TQM83999.1 Dyp-type peroxidase family [Saccharothrix saharensis]